MPTYTGLWWLIYAQTLSMDIIQGKKFITIINIIVWKEEKSIS